ncbi:hypothetical protein KR018_007130, partial [Drosophila ironensis]
ISYENRLRQYSHPLKIFRYFATIKMKNKSGRWDIYMTPKDFLRSQVPGVQQPEQLGLDKFRVLDEQGVSKWTSDIKPNSMFFKLEEKGLLTFSDYILLIILLAIPQRHIEIGFKLFDHDGDGILSINDMENVLMAITHGEASVMNAQLKHTLFGPQLNKDLSIQQFLGFLEKLNDEVITLEYEMLLKNSRQAYILTTITERDFANVVVGYKQNPKERSMALRRVKEKFGGHKQGITLSEYKDFFRLVKDVDAMDAALSFHYLAGAGISSESLRITARVVAGVRLTDHMVDVIFTIFDADGNGVLQRGEFLQLLRCRRKRAHAINFPLTSALNILCKCVY